MSHRFTRPSLTIHRRMALLTLILLGALSMLPGANPLAPRPAAAATIKLNGPLTTSGTVRVFSVSPDGKRVVYLADQDTDSVFELYSAPSAGGPSIRLNAPLPSGSTIIWQTDEQAFAISPNSAYVVYQVSLGNQGPYDIYSVPITGGTPVRLGGNVGDRSYQISPDSSRVIFLSNQGSASPYDLYSVPIAGGFIEKLNGPLDPSGYGISSYTISPDSAQVLYLADQDDTIDMRQWLYLAPLAGGSSRIVSPQPAYSTITRFRFSPDSQSILYIATDDRSMQQLYYVPQAGGTPVRLNADLPPPTGSSNPNVYNFWISPDSSRVVYDTDGNLYSVLLQGGTSLKLNGPIADGQFMDNANDSIQISPDSSRAIYSINAWDGYRIYIQELYSVPLAGGAPTLLSPPLQPKGSLVDIRIGADSRYIVFISEVDSAFPELYSVPLGGGSTVKLNGPLSGCTTCYVYDFQISPDGRRVVYRTWQGAAGYEFSVVPTGGGERIPLYRSPGHYYSVYEDYQVSPDSSGVFYRSNLDLYTGDELYAVDFSGDVISPATISDLDAHPDILGGWVQLLWTAPGDDDMTGGPVAGYDLRYSSRPILTESDWSSATRTPVTAIDGPGSAEELTVRDLATGVRWYFAIKAVDRAGNWSQLSNVPALQDMGFRPNPNGYSFSNNEFHDLTIDDLRKVFGDSRVCTNLNGQCEARKSAKRWLQSTNKSNSGVCAGMAATSLHFFKGYEPKPGDFQAAADVAFKLPESDALWHYIARTHIRQYGSPVADYAKHSGANSPSAILDQLRAALTGSAPDPLVLLMWDRNPDSLFNLKTPHGHSVTPFTIEDRGNGISHVLVYDNNFSDTLGVWISIDTNANTWSYPWKEWSGSANSHTLQIVPLSKFDEDLGCPWCWFGQTVSAQAMGQIWLSGSGHLQITDDQGRQIGYSGELFANEIPGARAMIPIGGLGIEREPIYQVPLSGPYAIALDGQTLTQTESLAVTQFGPGYATAVDDVMLTPYTRDQVTIAPNGAQVVYSAGLPRSPTLTLARESASSSDQFQIKGADVGAGQTISTTIDAAQRTLVFSSANASGGVYDLAISHIGTAGEQGFAYSGIPIAAGETHYLDYGAWESSGSLILRVDAGSDGTIDQTLVLDSQKQATYLPLLLR